MARNLLEGIATEETLAGVAAAALAVAGRANGDGTAVFVSGNRVRWRREFNDPTLADWIVSEGPGQTVSAANSTLTITCGTTAGAESTVTSRQAFTVPFDAQFGLMLSSKIANVEVYCEILAETPAGDGVDDTILAAWRIAGSDSTTNTVARTEVRNGASARSQSGNTTQAAQTGAMSIYQIVLESDEVRFFSKVGDSSGNRNAGVVRNTISPDPTRRYRVRYRVKNGTTAPASSVTVTASHVVATDYSEIKTEITGGSGSSNADQAVQVNGTVALGGGQTSLAASSSVQGLTSAKVRSAATTNATLVRNSATRVYGYHLTNLSTQWRYLKVFNKSSVPASTDAATVVTRVIPLPPNGVPVIYSPGGAPLTLGSGFGYTITASMNETDFTALTAADEVIGTIDYA